MINNGLGDSGGPPSQILEKCDVAVIEYCTLKRPKLDGWILNHDCLNPVIRAVNMNRGQVLYVLEHHPPGSEGRRSLGDSRVLRDLTLEILSPALIEAELRELRDRVGAPLVVTGHVPFRTPEGNIYPERAALREILREICASNDMVYFDSWPIIEQHGIETALEDFAHYRPTFNQVIADALVPILYRAAGRSEV